MKPRVWLLPIEPFDGRYTEQWFRWYPQDLRDDGWDVRLVVPEGIDVPDVGAGEFLHPVRTWEWKGAQVAELARAWPNIRDGDWILSLDGWGPATTAALYMRDATQKRVLVGGFMHAGCWDPEDFLPRRGMDKWGLDIERGWVKGLDLVLCGSTFAHDLMTRNLKLQHYAQTPVIANVGNPIKADEIRVRAAPTPWSMRRPVVVFPHRMAPEKDPDLWHHIVDAYRAKYRDHPAVFVESAQCETKDQYYRLLGKARVVVSTAKQETFGIAMQEGIACGAYAVAPMALSYPETVRVNTGLLFRRGKDAANDAADAIYKCLNRAEGPWWDGYHERAVYRASTCMKTIAKARGHGSKP